MYLTLTRFHSDSRQTIGVLKAVDKAGKCLHVFATLELPWLDNQKQNSCVPASVYKVLHRNTLKFGEHLHLQDVTGRDYILMHKGNYVKDTSGCILIGKYFTDLNNDGIIDIANSGVAMYDLVRIVPPGGTDLLIINSFYDPLTV